MGSGFLRDIALRKQLEEKVKEATKNRQLADKEVGAAQALIDQAKAIDAEVGEAEAALAEASALMGAKDYRSALEKAQEATERAKRAYADRARHFLDSTRSLMQTTKGLGLDHGEGLPALDKAEEAFAKESYEDAIELAKKAWKKSEKALHEHLSSSFSTAQALIMTAKNIGQDTATAEDLLSRARSAVEGNDFEMALSFTNECLETVRGELQAEVDRSTAEVQGAVKIVQDIGGDVSNVARLLDRARADVERGEYDKALNSLKQAGSETEKSLSKGLESRSKEFRGLLSEAEGIGADVGPARERFEAFEKALRDENLPEATRLAREGFELLQKAQFDRVLFTISASRDKFVTAKQIGADITPALEMLNRARQALQSGQFQEALASSKKADETVDQVVREYQSVEGEIRAMQRAFADAEVLGVDASASKRLLERAKIALSQRDFRGAVDFLRRSRDDLDRAQSDRAMEVIEKAEFLLTSAERMGAHLDEPSRTLEEAVTAAKGKNFAKAMEFATRSRELTERAIHRVLNDSIAGLQSSLQYLGEDASPVRTFLDRAESALSARDFESSFGYVEEAMRLAEGKTKDKALQFQELMREVVQIGIQLGCDVEALEQGLRDVNAGVDRGRYAEVIALKERLLREVGVASENVFNLVKGKVVEAKNLQIDITEMRELLKRAKMALGVEDYGESLQLLKECNEKANRTVGLHKEVYNAISSAAALVAEAKKRDVNVAPVLEMLLEAKRAHERFDHERALELAQRAKAETEKLMILYTSAQQIISARELLDVLERSGIEAPHLRELLEDAKDAMKNKEYEKALERSERGQAQVRELLQERVTSMLSASDALISTMEDLNLLAQEEALIRAREMLDAGRFAEAVDGANKVRDDIEKIKKASEEASIAIARARDVITEIESMNVQVPDAESRLGLAEKAYRDNRFEEAGQLAAELAEGLERERQEQIASMMGRFEEAIARAKRDKVDTRSAEKLLSRAKEFLKEKKYRQALALAMQSEGEAEKVGLQQDMASKAIATAEKKLGALSVPIPDLGKMLEEAKRSFADGDYVRALDVAIKTSEEFQHSREMYEEAVEVGRRAQKLRDAAFTVGIDTGKVDGVLEKAQAALSDGKPEAARDGFQKVLDSSLESVRSAVQGRLSDGRTFTEVGKRLDVDMATPNKKFSEAKALLDAENFEGADALVREGTEAALEALRALVGDAVAEARENLEHSRKLGANVKKSEELLAKADELLRGNEFEKALEVAQESQKVVQIRLDTEKRFAERSLQAESAIRRAKRFGVDVGEAERLLAQAIQTKKQDFEKGLSLAERAHEAAVQAIEAFSPNVTAALEVKEPVAGEWSEATLTLSNEGKALAKDVRVKVLGDAEVEGLKDVPVIRGKGKEALPLRVKMITAGSIPLAIQITSTRILDGKEYQHETIATVEAAESMPPEEALQATGESRCPLCRGLIKVGFVIKRCPHCSRDLHELCASRAAKCPACGKPLAEVAKRKKISFKVG